MGTAFAPPAFAENCAQRCDGSRFERGSAAHPPAALQALALDNFNVNYQYKLSDFISCLTYLSSLTVVSWRPALTISDVRHLTHLSSLKRLLLWRCGSKTNATLSAIACISGLRRLGILATHANDESVSQLTALTALSWLELGGTGVLTECVQLFASIAGC